MEKVQNFGLCTFPRLTFFGWSVVSLFLIQLCTEFYFETDQFQSCLTSYKYLMTKRDKNDNYCSFFFISTYVHNLFIVILSRISVTMVIIHIMLVLDLLSDIRKQNTTLKRSPTHGNVVYWSPKVILPENFAFNSKIDVKEILMF